MARPLRIEFPGALYHVMSRGNARQDIYTDDNDRREFLKNLEHCIKFHNLICHAYCLMGNHYHLLVETPDGNLSQAMRDINGNYTQKFHYLHNRVGHLLQGRYKAFVIEKEAYFLAVARYIVLNPVRDKLVEHPKLWKWSNYNATAGHNRGPVWLDVDTTLDLFS
ncbi:transposase, partial [Patescibacteria group bacterium]|nr:transposase [Patescibacteria group bacterium]